ncbi:protein takeout-like [Musca autumnalis]|uniref:protein takeout-like n=1 Tax=Musca autumnalis TaxID=221902 RepID=UPI003CF13F81
MKYFTIATFTLVFGIATLAAERTILSEKPDFLATCSVKSSDAGACFAKNIEGMFYHWKNGIPGLKSFGSLDPLHIKRIAIAQADGGPIAVNLNLKNVEVFGLSATSITDNGSDVKNLILKFKLNEPTFKITCDYALRGKLLAYSANSKGQAVIEMDKALQTLTLHVKIREEDNFKFAEVDKVQMVWDDVGGMRVHFSNLFNGDAALEKSADELINASWRSIFDVIRPALEQSQEGLLKKFLSKIFRHVPFSYLLEDL